MQEGGVIKIDRKIVDCSVVKPETEKPAAPVFKPYERPAVLDGKTYKIRPPTMNAALYITINDIVLDDGTMRPFELFLHSKDKAHEQWMMALTRTASGVFRHPVPFEFLIEEWEQVVDPNGQYFIRKGDPGGKGRCASVVAHVGRVLRQHCVARGMMKPPEQTPEQKAAIEEKKAQAVASGIKGQMCPKCQEATVYVLDGCATCVSCGNSHCS